jgi:cytochrome oxidase Cu insertion factor (SCO1/SenC/PrrC family)
MPRATISCAALALSSLVSIACGGAGRTEARTPSATPEAASAPAVSASPTSDEVAVAGRAAPPFHVTSTDGAVYDSATLAGRPIVLVFFTTWCPKEVPIVENVLSQAGPQVTALGVALDDEDTWAKVPAYVAERKISFPIVQGTSSPALMASYDPSSSFPVVVLIDARGTVALLEHGAADDGGKALSEALAAARQ